MLGHQILVNGRIGTLEARIQALEQNAESEPSKDA